MKKNYLIKLFFLSYLICIISCTSKQGNKTSPTPKVGLWRMEMSLNKSVLPFNFELFKDSMIIINGEERISQNNIEYKHDSIIIKHPVFESEFILQHINDTLLIGEWINYYKGNDYKIPVRAEYNHSYRFFEKNSTNYPNISGKYEVLFSPKKSSSKAIGIVSQNDNIIKATFATETGDYRFLEGEIKNDSLFLSTFDGSHAFLFEAAIISDTLKGVFWSGTHWEENWIGFKNDSVSLTNPDSLTYLKNNQEIKFSLKSSNNNYINYPSSDLDGQVVILQIMGSWCPNCLDETYYLSSQYNKYKDDGLSIYAVAFERTRSEKQAIDNLKAIKSKTQANYPFLLGGYNRKTKATDLFPMLNHIMSYPTTIFIDKKGNVRKIHTGFYGPGTGEYYEQFVKETDTFIKSLLAES